MKFFCVFLLSAQPVFAYFALCGTTEVKVYKSEDSFKNRYEGLRERPQIFSVDLGSVKKARWEKGAFQFLSEAGDVAFSLRGSDFEKIRVDFPLEEFLVCGGASKKNPLKLVFSRLDTVSAVGDIRDLDIHVLGANSEGVNMNFNPEARLAPSSRMEKFKLFLENHFPYMCFLGSVLYVLVQEYWEYY